MTQIKKFKNGQVKIDLDKLNVLQKALSSGMRTQVGILGSKARSRKTSVYGIGADGVAFSKVGKTAATMTNAEIGLKHEKGSISDKIPRRSFLEFPLYAKAAQLLTIKTELWAAFKTSSMSLKKAYRELGLKAEVIIQEAFETHGFGTWKPNSDKTIAMKGSDSPLIDTAQLRRSISSRVVG